MRVADFDFELPESLIAQSPLATRDASRLLIVPREGELLHRTIRDLPTFVRPGDLLVVNDARVIPARLRGVKEPSGGKAELLLVEEMEKNVVGSRWLALGQASKALRAGQRIRFSHGLTVEVIGARGEGTYEVALPLAGDALLAALDRAGELPLPPYIDRPPTVADAERYQTVFARVPGAVAAPTAGLHFTPELFAALEARGVARTTITLLVGPGTFLPVRTDDVESHRMHKERYEVPSAAADAFAQTRARGGRVIAVGTTALRTLEAATDAQGRLQRGPGATDIFIYPGYRFRAVDALFTNFHLPRSTLLMLVSAFGGKDRLLDAYRAAVAERYRFFSYGDAMLLL